MYQINLNSIKDGIPNALKAEAKDVALNNHQIPVHDHKWPYRNEKIDEICWMIYRFLGIDVSDFEFRPVSESHSDSEFPPNSEFGPNSEFRTDSELRSLQISNEKRPKIFCLAGQHQILVDGIDYIAQVASKKNFLEFFKWKFCDKKI